MQTEDESLKWMNEDATRISPAIYADPEIYAREQERIFTKVWLLLGHESQLPEKGAFVRTFMGEEPIILARGLDGEIHANLNMCRHRGFELCQEDQGVAKRFQCPYHGWTFSVEGELVGVPGLRTLYYGELDRSEHALIPVPRIEVYKGLIFGSFDSEAEPLVEYLGDMTWYLDTLLDRRAGGTELIGVQRWKVKANWKVVAENHVGDEYHIGYAHGSFFPPELEDRAAPLPFAREVCPKPGHGMGAHFYPLDLDDLEWAMLATGGQEDIAQYLADIAPEVRDRLGVERSRLLPVHGAVYPNFGLVPVFNSLRVIHPRGVDSVEIWSYCLVDKEAPPKVKAMLKATCMSTFGPSGRFEQDDSNNWAAITRNAKRPISKNVRLNLDMGVGHESVDPVHPGVFGLTASEVNQRSFYRRWAQDMSKELGTRG